MFVTVPGFINVATNQTTDRERCGDVEAQWSQTTDACVRVLHLLTLRRRPCKSFSWNQSAIMLEFRL